MKQTIKFLSLMTLITGCSSIQATDAGNKVKVTVNSIPKDCEYLGQVSGNQGLQGSFMSPRELDEGSMNSMKNNAAMLGANRIELITTHNTNGMLQDTINLGSAYKCQDTASMSH